MPNLRPRDNSSPRNRLIKNSSSISVSQSWGGGRHDKIRDSVWTAVCRAVRRGVPNFQPAASLKGVQEAQISYNLLLFPSFYYRTLT